MKKLVSIFCCVLCMRSFSQTPADMRVLTQRPSGEKVLIKAITAMVNREGKKKMPVRKINLPSSDSPQG